MTFRTVLLTVFCLLSPCYAVALTLPVNGQNTLNFHTRIDTVYATKASSTRQALPQTTAFEIAEWLTFRLVTPHTSLTYNTTYPHGYNDGAQWSAAGANLAARTGALLEGPFYRVAFVPEVYWAQNQEFDYRPAERQGISPFSDHWYRIDLVQRFGEEPFWSFDPGSTEARLHYAGLTVGLSHDAIWLGPALINPIILSLQAPAFWHLDLGTLGSVPTPVGRVEARTLWGVLEESEYFDEDPDNDTRLISALTVAYSPRWLPQFTFGFNRLFTVPWTPFAWEPDKLFQLWEPFFKDKLISDENPEGLDQSDQMASVTVEYENREDNFRVYFEWARNDHELNFEYFLLTPQHTHAYTIGFEKTYWFNTRTVSLYLAGEVSSTARPTSHIARPMGPWYVHSRSAQGHTNQGQMLGPPIGSGGNAQYACIGVGVAPVSVSLYAYRFNRNNDVYLERFGPWHRAEFTDVEMTLGLESELILFDRVALTLDTAFSRNYNRDFRLNYTVDEEGNVVEEDLDNDIENVCVSVGLRYNF